MFGFFKRVFGFKYEEEIDSNPFCDQLQDDEEWFTDKDGQTRRKKRKKSCCGGEDCNLVDDGGLDVPDLSDAVSSIQLLIPNDDSVQTDSSEIQSDVPVTTSETLTPPIQSNDTPSYSPPPPSYDSGSSW